jgi:hypothetical protein
VFAASAYFKICHRSDPDIDSCMNNTIEDLKPRILKGKEEQAHCITMA